MRGNVAAWQKIAAMLTDKSCIGVAENYGKPSAVVENMYTFFTEGSALFMPGPLSLLETGMPDCVSFSLGLLPLPKLDERAGGLHFPGRRVSDNLLCRSRHESGTCSRLLSAGSDGMLWQGNVQ